MLRPSAADRRTTPPASVAVTPVVADCAFIAVTAFATLVAAVVVPAMLMVVPFNVIVSVPPAVIALVVVPVAVLTFAVALQPLMPAELIAAATDFASVAMVPKFTTWLPAAVAIVAVKP